MIPDGFINLDIELTNRCNAKCHFCPRDATPHQGLMTRETFEQALVRAKEMRERTDRDLGRELRISLCGLGEPLLNPLAIEATRRVTEEGFTCGMASNAALLNEKKARSLLDAGLRHIEINVGEQGEDYEAIYKLPWERTFDNVVRFADMAEGRCEINIVLVDHRQDLEHREAMMAFWRQHGLENFIAFSIMNRGGALFVDHMQFDQLPQRAQAAAMLAERTDRPLCFAPFVYLFIGYDGHYYLCCSDWTKEAPLGTVFDETFESVMDAKLEHLFTRRPVCQTCNHDPLNRLTDALRATEEGDTETMAPEVMADDIARETADVLGIVETLRPGLVERVQPPAPRRTIPVTAR